MELVATRRNGFNLYDTRQVIATAAIIATEESLTYPEILPALLIENNLIFTQTGYVVELLGETTLEFATKELLENGA